jgi:hypothetical protein
VREGYEWFLVRRFRRDLGAFRSDRGEASGVVRGELHVTHRGEGQYLTLIEAGDERWKRCYKAYVVERLHGRGGRWRRNGIRLRARVEMEDC